jgi:hypothetical protein
MFQPFKKNLLLDGSPANLMLISMRKNTVMPMSKKPIKLINPGGIE